MVLSLSLTRTFGGPIRLGRDAWKNYTRSLERNPVYTKACTSLVAGIVGDAIAQVITAKPGTPYDYMRTLRLAAFGGLIGGPLGHAWYQFLDTNTFRRAPTSAIAIASKVAMDQFAYAPVGTCIFYAFLTATELRPDEYLATLRDKWWPSLAAGWKLWIPAHAVNFALVPPSQRILYANVMSIAGTFILSRIANEAAGDKGGAMPALAGVDTVIDASVASSGAHASTAARGRMLGGQQQQQQRAPCGHHSHRHRSRHD